MNIDSSLKGKMAFLENKFMCNFFKSFWRQTLEAKHITMPNVFLKRPNKLNLQQGSYIKARLQKPCSAARFEALLIATQNCVDLSIYFIILC